MSAEVCSCNTVFFFLSVLLNELEHVDVTLFWFLPSVGCSKPEVSSGIKCCSVSSSFLYWLHPDAFVLYRLQLLMQWADRNCIKMVLSYRLIKLYMAHYKASHDFSLFCYIHIVYQLREWDGNPLDIIVLEKVPVWASFPRFGLFCLQVQSLEWENCTNLKSKQEVRSRKTAQLVMKVIVMVEVSWRIFITCKQIK